MCSEDHLKSHLYYKGWFRERRKALFIICAAYMAETVFISYIQNTAPPDTKHVTYSISRCLANYLTRLNVHH